MIIRIIKVLFSLISGVAVTILCVEIYKTITQQTIQQEVKQKCPDALRAEILEKQKNAVKLGIFGKNDNEYSTKLTISSNKGVDDRLRKGMIIYV